ncbi:hypothetical protein [Nitrosopumilus adriaticus]|uniref:hypothetical protein n=1 Tax=Nitrosopumilus adriaticus TaxID=1580092 RepID=UPI00352C9705
MGKDADDAAVTFVAWIVTGILILLIGGGVAIGVSMITDIVGGMIAFFAVAATIVVFMTKLLNSHYARNSE